MADLAVMAILRRVALRRALTLVGDLDAGAAGLARVGVGVSVDTANGRPDARARTGLAALSLVGDLDAVAPRVDRAAAVGDAVGAADRLVA